MFCHSVDAGLDLTEYLTLSFCCLCSVPDVSVVNSSVSVCVCVVCVCSAPDVSVVSSSVSGHEGGDISVQCLYSSGYQNKTKQWCRYKDQSCYTVGRNATSQNSSVQISDDDDDDGRSSFTVLMTGLRRTDSGWYFCSVGDLQVPVQLTVTEAKPGKAQSIINIIKALILNKTRPNELVLFLCLTEIVTIQPGTKTVEDTSVIVL